MTSKRCPECDQVIVFRPDQATLALPFLRDRVLLRP